MVASWSVLLHVRMPADVRMPRETGSLSSRRLSDSSNRVHVNNNPGRALPAMLAGVLVALQPPL